MPLSTPAPLCCAAKFCAHISATSIANVETKTRLISPTSSPASVAPRPRPAAWPHAVVRHYLPVLMDRAHIACIEGIRRAIPNVECALLAPALQLPENEYSHRSESIFY